MTEQTELEFTKSSRKRRIAAFFIDHCVMTFLMVLMIFVALGPNFMDQNNPIKITITIFLVITLGFFLYFAKDSIKGISVGRWVMGIMVREETNQNSTPSFGKMIKRNLFLIIWPVEFIIFATNEEKKRLGDKASKTVVLQNPNKPKRLQRILVLVCIGIGFVGFVFLFAGSAMKSTDAYKVAIQNVEINSDIITETGGITGYGMMPSGSVSVKNGQGEAELHITVHGKTKDIEVSMHLEKEQNGQWKLIEMKK